MDKPINDYIFKTYFPELSRDAIKYLRKSTAYKDYVNRQSSRVALPVVEEEGKDEEVPADTPNTGGKNVRKAFDSVSHHSIARMLDWVGIPGHGDMYRRCTTGIFALNVNITIGVKQGDPLSSVLFNLIMNLVLQKISAKIGVNLFGEELSWLAFADDLVLCARSRRALQDLVDKVTARLAGVGL